MDVTKQLMLSSGEIEALYQPLFRIGALGSTAADGFFRPSWSAEEEAAFTYIRAEGEKIGLLARFDQVGNLFLEQPGFQEYAECGSHLDTVINGGNYDGAAGVVAGLAAIRAIVQTRMPTKRGLRLRVWRGEESATFFTGCKGSRAAFGALPPEALTKAFHGKTLGDAITALGYSPEPVVAKRPTISREEIDGIHAHLELHIEQANSLEQLEADIGVVSSIRGPSRWLIVLRGRFDHSGGTPMGTKYRRDVNLALGYIMVALDELCQGALQRGHDLVQTIGVINSDQQLTAQHPAVMHNALAKVSGFGYFSLDIRSCQKSFRAAYVERALDEIRRIALSYGVEAMIEKISETDPCETLDGDIQALELSTAKKLNYAVVTIPSGAVHDCLYVGEQTRSNGTRVPIGMLFIPCREGISHAPEEFTTFEAIAKGANVLGHTLYELVKD